MPDLQPFAKNLRIFDGPNVRDMGFMFTTRMAVVTLSDGSLWVNSPVSVPSIRSNASPNWGRSDTSLRQRPGMSGGWRRGTRCFPKPSYGRRAARRSR